MELLTMAYRKHDFGDTLSEVYLQWDQSASFQSRVGFKFCGVAWACGSTDWLGRIQVFQAHTTKLHHLLP